MIDELQIAPGHFPVLRVPIDRSPANGQFLLLGSAYPALLRQAGESLLGRAEVIQFGGFGVGFKRADAPQLTPSMKIAMHDLQLDRLYVVYPGTLRYPLAERIEAVPLAALVPPAPPSPVGTEA